MLSRVWNQSHGRQKIPVNIWDTLTKHGKIKCIMLSTKTKQKKKGQSQSHKFMCWGLIYMFGWSFVLLWPERGNTGGPQMQTKLSRDTARTSRSHLMVSFWCTEPSTRHLNHRALYLSTDNRNGPAASSSSHSLPAIQLRCVQSPIITLSENLYIINGK